MGKQFHAFLFVPLWFDAAGSNTLHKQVVKCTCPQYSCHAPSTSIKVRDIYQQQPSKRCLMWLCMYLPHVCIYLINCFLKAWSLWLFSLELTPAVPQCLLFTAKTGWRAALALWLSPRCFSEVEHSEQSFLLRNVSALIESKSNCPFLDNIND